jgi:hypothetical protein
MYRAGENFEANMCMEQLSEQGFAKTYLTKNRANYVEPLI